MEFLDYVFYSPSGPFVFPSSLRPGRVGRKTAASAPHSFTLTPAVLVIGCGVLNWRDLTGWRIDCVSANLRHATAISQVGIAVAGLRLADSHRCADGPIFARIPGNRGITERRLEGISATNNGCVTLLPPIHISEPTRRPEKSYAVFCS